MVNNVLIWKYANVPISFPYCLLLTVYRLLLNNMEQQYIDLYKSHHESIKKHSASVMNSLRDAAFAQFEKLGFPTVALENYKYTDLKEPLSVD